MKTLLHRAAGSILLLLAASLPYPARAQDRQVEAGFEDDATVKGTSGSKSDPDLEVWGYAGFGTNFSAASAFTSGVGNVFIQNHLEVGSNEYVHGGLTSGSTTGFQVNATGDISKINGVPSAWPSAQGATNTYLRNDGAGTLSWGKPLASAVTLFADETTVVWAGQPAALTEFLATTRYRGKFDLTYANEVRLSVFVATAGAATPAKIAAQFSTDQVTWVYFGATNSPIVPINAAGLIVSGWSNLVVGAKGDVFIRLVGYDGNGAANPAFGAVSVQFR